MARPSAVNLRREPSCSTIALLVALRTRVLNYGKILLLAGALAGTFFLFAGIAMRVAVRARQVTVPNLIGKSIDWPRLNPVPNPDAGCA